MRNLPGKTGDISRFALVHTDIEVSMEDNPLSVRREKKDSSMCVGLRLLADGDGDALSAQGIPARFYRVKPYCPQDSRNTPRGNSQHNRSAPVLLHDAGANVTVTATYLEHFAIMGGVYMRCVMGTQNPRVGLLNNGAEACKGTPLQTEAYVLLAKANTLILSGTSGPQSRSKTADVLVADGFTGNVLLKSIEGMGKLLSTSLKSCFEANAVTIFAGLLMKNRLREFKRRFDLDLRRPFLRLNRPVIRRTAPQTQGYKKRCRQAISYSKTRVTKEIADELKSV